MRLKSRAENKGFSMGKPKTEDGGGIKLLAMASVVSNTIFSLLISLINFFFTMAYFLVTIGNQ